MSGIVSKLNNPILIAIVTGLFVYGIIRRVI